MVNIEKLLIATTNSHKLAEFKHLFVGSSCKIITPIELGLHLPPVAETGDTLQINARLKAACWSKCSGHWTLADDTGLEVDALDGQPGVRSARFAGENATMSENRQKLLNQLRRTRNASRAARFQCVLALANPEGEIVHEATGICRGEILEDAASDIGFGYDSLFWIPEAGKTLSQMNMEETARYSHRSLAVNDLRRQVML